MLWQRSRRLVDRLCPLLPILPEKEELQFGLTSWAFIPIFYYLGFLAQHQNIWFLLLCSPSCRLCIQANAIFGATWLLYFNFNFWAGYRPLIVSMLYVNSFQFRGSHIHCFLRLHHSLFCTIHREQWNILSNVGIYYHPLPPPPTHTHILSPHPQPGAKWFWWPGIHHWYKYLQKGAWYGTIPNCLWIIVRVKQKNRHDPKSVLHKCP